jgi:trans-aconitate 2-methyltransferase
MWNANVYGQFEKERMQPSIDLINRIDSGNFSRILDVGCGSGMSTLPLRKRFVDADITGVDLSENMLKEAGKRLGSVNWIRRDCSKPLKDLGTFDLVFSNAFLQWVKNQEEVIENLSELLYDKGKLAIQVPNFEAMTIATLINKTAEVFDPEGTLFNKLAESSCHNYSLEQYYDWFSRYFENIEVWQTNYVHQLDSSWDIIEFVRGTALLPYLGCLDPQQEKQFLEQLQQTVMAHYPSRENKKVLFEFKRIFIIASR